MASNVLGHDNQSAEVTHPRVRGAGGRSEEFAGSDGRMTCEGGEIHTTYEWIKF